MLRTCCHTFYRHSIWVFRMLPSDAKNQNELKIGRNAAKFERWREIDSSCVPRLVKIYFIQLASVATLLRIEIKRESWNCQEGHLCTDLLNDSPFCMCMFWRNPPGQRCLCTARHSTAHCTSRRCLCLGTNACPSLGSMPLPSRTRTCSSVPGRERTKS